MLLQVKFICVKNFIQMNTVVLAIKCNKHSLVQIYFRIHGISKMSMKKNLSILKLYHHFLRSPITDVIIEWSMECASNDEILAEVFLKGQKHFFFRIQKLEFFVLSFSKNCYQTFAKTILEVFKEIEILMII